jgi:hypothetical protein
LAYSSTAQHAAKRHFAIAPNINILVHEQLTFVERLKKDIEKNPIEREKGKRVEEVPIENGFQGSIERKKHFHNLMPHKC